MSPLKSSYSSHSPLLPFQTLRQQTPEGQWPLRSPCFRSLASAAAGSPCLHLLVTHTLPTRLLLVPRTQKSFLKAPHTLREKQARPLPPVPGVSGLALQIPRMPPWAPPSDTWGSVSGITLPLDHLPRPAGPAPSPTLDSAHGGVRPHSSGRPALLLAPVRGQFYRKGHRCAGWACLDLPSRVFTSSVHSPGSCLGPLGALRPERWSCAP